MGSYSLTDEHTCDPVPHSEGSPQVWRSMPYREGLEASNRAIGARPAAFNTVRCSEAAREYGITVQTVDLSEIIGKAERLRDDEAVVRASGDTVIRPRVCQNLAEKIAARAAIDTWMQETTCKPLPSNAGMHGDSSSRSRTAMSMMSNNLLPSACEVDV